MKKRIKNRWIKALKSGEYVQGKDRLYNPEDNTYCCLGVLCKLYAKDKKKGLQKVINMPGSDEGAVLPSAVAKWAGIEGELDIYNSPNVITSTRQVELVTLNDHDNLTFEEIADILKIGTVVL